ncbi:viroplasmin family protein [Candidatus Woesearchaeota archaeon]|nr:viroplasmin family protein [Candidatus Woesearchaeota archaeon]
MKFYAVAKGRGKVPAIYESWDACKEKVQGYPDARYKSFKTREEAEEFLGLHVQDVYIFPYEAYVDGSFNGKDYSYGYVILLRGKIIEQVGKKGHNKDAVALHQVYGELSGVLAVMKYCVNHDINEIMIHYDYTGIESWARGTWKRNNTFTMDYHTRMQKYMKTIKVGFTKVRAHSGDAYNDLADSLAKQALL